MEFCLSFPDADDEALPHTSVHKVLCQTSALSINIVSDEDDNCCVIRKPL